MVCAGAVLAIAPAGLSAAQRASPLRSAEASAGAPSATPIDAASARQALTRYCVGCHSDRLRTGGLSLSGADTNDLAASAALWEKVVQKLRGGAMPPSGAARPEKPLYEGLTAWIEGELDRAAEADPKPGRTPAFHRLNRTEYRNAVRDLLALDIDVAGLLPSDDSSYGFDNIGDALGMSPTLLESYLEAARRIAEEALGDPAIGRETVTYRVPADLTQDYRLEGLPFGTRGGVRVGHYFPVAGEYVIKVQLLRSFIGGIMGLAEAHELEFAIDGERVQLFTVGGKKKAEGEGERRSDIPDDAHLEVRLPVKAGAHQVTAAFLERPAVQGEDLRPPYLRSYAVLSDFASGQPHVASLAITGPFDGAPGGATPSRERIFVCRPESAVQERPCARRILAALARKAYRRPVADEDLRPLLDFYDAGRKGGRFDTGIQRALQRLLVSPEFLVRVERDPAKTAPGAIYRVSDLELASRLSFFLWSSLPDEELLRLAEAGRLQEPAVLESQVRRMLGDDKARALVANFAGQWLYLRNVPSTRPDTQLFPDFDDNLRQAMRRETELLFDHVLRRGRSVTELLTARYTFVNERLARHYGMPGVYGSHFRRVDLAADDPRGGLLGQAAILTVTAYPNRTSPVLRGKWVLENVLNAPPPPPPPNVPELQERNASGRVLSMRERMEQHRANPVCAGCHSRMDPLGLALEHFDAVGRWRDMSEARAPIDATGSLPDGTRFNGPRELRQALSATPERFVSTATERLLTYALGRGLTHEDAPAVRAIVRRTRPRGYRLDDIVLEVVRSTPFQMRRSRS